MACTPALPDRRRSRAAEAHTVLAATLVYRTRRESVRDARKRNETGAGGRHGPAPPPLRDGSLAMATMFKESGRASGMRM
jgi:hypothetical protein